MSQTEAPLISVIVAVYNVVDHVRDAVASIKAQTLTDFEALIVDDGSTDGSGALASEICAGDPRFRVIRQANRGLSGARNAGLDQARGRFIAFLDGDDAFAPDFLSTLHDTLTRQNTDWAACAIELAYPDGTRISHPALHASEPLDAPQILALADAREAVRVFPSAWNKLYRRALFDNLRYPEGSWFEDHEVFWAIAARAPALAYTPVPLYLHRRERAGQITGSDDDRVFDQLRVLDRLYPRLMTMAHGKEGYDRLATRLVYERASVLADRDRRARFLTATFALFDRLGTHWSPDWDPEISRHLGMVLAGKTPLTVVVLDPHPAAVLARLDRGVQDSFELLVAAPDAPATLPSGQKVTRIEAEGLTPRRLAELVQGEWVIVLAPGEAPEADGLKWLFNLAVETGCDLGIGALTRDGLGYHDGWTNNEALGFDLAALPARGGAIGMGEGALTRQYPALGNRILRRDLLAGMPERDVLRGDPLSVQMLVFELAQAARSVAYTRYSVARIPDVMAGGGGLLRLRRAVARATSPGLGPRRRGQVFLRLLRLTGLRGTLRWALAAVLVLLSGWAPGHPRVHPHSQPDPETPRLARRMLTRGRR
ncbi:glycosyltransferase family 2 protein [Rhodobacter sp. NTK016B]|uniref:glycosyltransferase n=1 Tax=Rhodobacter sp. NTK016B TaxID=2759676 RepID=UPI001A908A37|nr:glycosyltransferase [Rhodobacter sp. NTK016B]MBN8293006.1 glycosyltransferase family 2 protein [Rhodobacter sp. NTK016B]